jgi:hypothetical protein
LSSFPAQPQLQQLNIQQPQLQQLNLGQPQFGGRGSLPQFGGRGSFPAQPNFGR